MSDELRKVISQPEVKKQFATRGSYARAMSPAEVTAFIHREQQQWSPVLRRLASQP